MQLDKSQQVTLANRLQARERNFKINNLEAWEQRNYLTTKIDDKIPYEIVTKDKKVIYYLAPHYHLINGYLN